MRGFSNGAAKSFIARLWNLLPSSAFALLFSRLGSRALPTAQRVFPLPEVPVSHKENWYFVERVNIAVVKSRRSRMFTRDRSSLSWHGSEILFRAENGRTRANRVGRKINVIITRLLLLMHTYTCAYHSRPVSNPFNYRAQTYGRILNKEPNVLELRGSRSCSSPLFLFLPKQNSFTSPRLPFAFVTSRWSRQCSQRGPSRSSHGPPFSLDFIVFAWSARHEIITTWNSAAVIELRWLIAISYRQSNGYVASLELVYCGKSCVQMLKFPCATNSWLLFQCINIQLY